MKCEVRSSLVGDICRRTPRLEVVEALSGSSRNTEGAQRLYERIYEVVRLIPAGRVATYGQIAAIVGWCTPRLVGYAMAALPFGCDAPWHRVINSQGRISTRGSGDGHVVQRTLLEAEGVAFDEGGRVDLAEVGWEGSEMWDCADSVQG